MTHFPLLSSVMLLAAVPVVAALTAEESLETFSAANDAFQQGNELLSDDPSAAYDLYSRAALRFERLLQDGEVRNGKLHYNLGNAYFRMGDVGQAILHYRRAELYRPGDQNLRQNLRYARSQRLDRFEPTAHLRALRTLFFWHYDFAPTTRLRLLTALWSVFWGVAAVRLFRPRWITRSALWLPGLPALLLAASLGVDAAGGAEKSGVVTAQETVARKGDGAGYEPSFTEPLHAGAEFRLVERRPEWLLAELSDGRMAWIEAPAAEIVEQGL